METEIHVPTVLSHSIAAGKYGHRPLNHAVRELGLKVLARQIVHRGHFHTQNALDPQHKADNLSSQL